LLNSAIDFSKPVFLGAILFNTNNRYSKQKCLIDKIEKFTNNRFLMRDDQQTWSRLAPHLGNSTRVEEST
jgi:hypothetical protein